MRDSEKKLKIKEYINNYMCELQRHFDLSDKKMRLILYEVYKDSGRISKFYKLIKKYISMVKSFYIKKLRRIK